MRSRAVLTAVVILGLTGSVLRAGASPPEAGPAGAPAGAFALRGLSVASDASTGATFDPGFTATGVRICRFLPGVSQAATLGPAPSAPAPAPLPDPIQSSVPTATTAAQLALFDAAALAVRDKYVDPAINGLNWDAITTQYRAKAQAGLSDAEFGKLMKAYINALGDGHSYYQSKADVDEQQETIEHGASFVGIGASFLPGADGTASVIFVLPGSPAALAGIRPHDLVLSVNGGPLRLADGTITTRGEPGTSVALLVRRGNGVPFAVTAVRAAVSAPAPVDVCLVGGTRVAYVFIPTFLDASITSQVRSALQKLTADGPLSGVIIDNRMNGGGLSSQALGVLGFFTSGNQGAYVSRTSTTPFNVVAEPVGNSQTVPLVVLVGEGTVSFGEIFSGVLQRAGRATIVGTTTDGNVELLNAIELADGSRVWLAQSTFQPVGLPAGTWEDTGIVPAIVVNGQWREFTELDDPGLARALKVLSP